MKPPSFLLTLLLPSILYADQSFSIDRNDQSITIKSNNHSLPTTKPSTHNSRKPKTTTITIPTTPAPPTPPFPDAAPTHPRWAFPGFSLPIPKPGKLSTPPPEGPANLPTPIHTKPESD